MSSCPALEQIELLAAGRLAGEQAARVRSHVESCSHCAEQYQECRANQDFAAELQAHLGSGSTVGFPPAASPLGGASTTTPAIPGYRLVREIHRGGQGVVYEAFQESTRRRVALKVMLGGPFAAEASKRRFEREVELAASLNHPNIVTIHDSGISSGAYYFAMDYVDGVRLDDYARGYRAATVGKRTPDAKSAACAPSSPSEAGGPTRPLSIPDTLQLFANVASAVNYAHQRGVIHRDLKPSNILVDADGQPHVLDFGLAKQTAEARTRIDPTLVSLEGHVLGTLAYMSPEHTAGVPAEIDVRSDVYSLGVILYELLTGTFPYPVTGLMAEVFANITSAEPKRPSAISRQIDDEVETIVLKALSKPKDRRYQTAGDLAADLERYLAGETIEAKRDSGWYVLKKTLRRYRLPVGVAAAFVVVVTAALVITTASLRQARRDHARAEWQSYLANIHAADSALRLHDAVEARIRLEQIPAKFHTNWEWRYLHSHLDQSLATLRGHTDAVTCVAFSPEGTWLASASNDKTVRIWDVATGQERCALTAHHGHVQCVALSPDGTRIASGSDDRAVRVWDTETGRGLRVLRDLEFPVGSVAFSPDGKTLAAGSSTPERQSGYVALWDTATGEESARWQAHGWAVGGVTFSPDGKRLITGGEDALVRIWDGATGWNMSDQLRCGSERVDGVTSVAVTSDGGLIAAGTKSGLVRLWTADTLEETHDLAGHARKVTSVAFSRDGAVLASASDDKTVRFWSTTTGRQIACLTGHTDVVDSVAVSPDGRLLASASVDGTIKLWDAVRTDAVPTLRGHAHRPLSDVAAVAFRPDGAVLATGSRDRTVRLWDVHTSEELAVLPHETEVKGVAFVPAGDRLISATWGGQVRVWDVATRQQMSQFRVCDTGDPALVSIALSPEGGRITVASGSLLHVWDVTAGERLLPPLAGHEDSVYHVSYNPTGTLLASASADHTVRVWDPSSGVSLAVLAGHTARVCGVVFSPDGALLASASADRSVMLWRTDTWTSVTRCDGHSDVVESVTFSPDGQRIASACADHTIKLWDVKTTAEVLTLGGHDGAVTTLLFSSDGSVIASGDAEGLVKLWTDAPRWSRSVQSTTPDRL